MAARPTARSPWIDFFVLAIPLAIVNFAFNREDLGWRLVNPSPYLLVPLLIGARYGFRPGLLSGVVSAAFVLAAIFFTQGGELRSILVRDAFFLVSFPVVGGLIGEIHRRLVSRWKAGSDRVEDAEHEVAEAHAELGAVREARYDLQQRLAAEGASVGSLDLQLAALLRPGSPGVWPGLLRMLQQNADVIEAAIFHVDGGGLHREEATATWGDDPDADEEMISEALGRDQLVTCRELWAETSRQRGIIAVVPMVGRRVLVIRRMAFPAVNWQNFSRIETMVRWAAFLSERAESGVDDLQDPVAFDRAVALAEEGERSHGLPSTVVEFEGLGSNGDAPPRDRLVGAIGSALRPTDIASAEGKNVRVLLPFVGERDAEIFLSRVRKSVEEDSALVGKVMETVRSITPKGNEK